MPLISSKDYRPMFLHRNGHLGTLIPHLFNHNKVNGLVRERIETPDEDILDVDLYKRDRNRLAILCHGLEGSSESNYIHNMASLLIANGFDIAAINYRGCSGHMNLKLRMYHSGATDDIHTVIQNYAAHYTEIALIGYSLGANMVTKYAGESSFIKSDKIKAFVGISAPCDLAACSDVISKKSNYIYEKRFLVSLTKKLKAKASRFPDDIDLDKLRSVKTLKDFDNYFTGPIHGFKDAAEYYEINSSNRFLEGINTPTLIVNAYNDPFLHSNSFPIKQAQDMEYVHLSLPKYGGHVGFMGTGKKYSWADLKALDFITNNLMDEV